MPSTDFPRPSAAAVRPPSLPSAPEAPPAAAAAVGPERSATWRGGSAALAQDSAAVSGYVRIQDRKGHLLGAKTAEFGQIRMLHSAYAIYCKFVEICAPSVHLPRLLSPEASLAAFWVVGPLAKRACALVADRALEPRELQRIRALRPKEQLERILQLANAQPQTTEGIKRSLQALQKLQAQHSDDLSPLEVGRSIVRLAAGAVQALEPLTTIQLLEGRLESREVHFTDIALLTDALFGMARSSQLTPDELADLLAGLAVQISIQLSLDGPGGPPMLAQREVLGLHFVALATGLADTVPGATSAQVIRCIQGLLDAHALVTPATLGRLVDGSAEPGATPQARLEHLGRCVQRAAMGPFAADPAQAALTLASELLRVNPRAYAGHPDERPEVRAAEFLIERLGNRIFAEHVNAIVSFLGSKTGAKATFEFLLHMARGSYPPSVRALACLNLGFIRTPETSDRFPQALSALPPGALQAGLDQIPGPLLRRFVEVLADGLREVQPASTRARLYLELADALGPRRDLSPAFTLAPTGLIDAQEVQSLALLLAQSSPDSPAWARAEGFGQLLEAPARRPMLLARLLVLGQATTTAASVRNLVSAIAGMPEFDPRRHPPHDRPKLALALQEVIDQAFAEAGRYILMNDMQAPPLDEAGIAQATAAHRQRLEQEFRERSDRKGLDLEEEAQLQAQVDAFEGELRGSPRQSSLPHAWLDAGFLRELHAIGLARAGLTPARDDDLTAGPGSAASRKRPGH